MLQKVWHHCRIIAQEVEVNNQEVLEKGQLEPYLQRVGLIAGLRRTLDILSCVKDAKDVNIGKVYLIVVCAKVVQVPKAKDASRTKVSPWICTLEPKLLPALIL